MTGRRAWVEQQARLPHGRRWAVTADIDNTSLATGDDQIRRIGAVLGFARPIRAAVHARGGAVLFNTGRPDQERGAVADRLRAGGFRPDLVCGPTSAREPLAHSHQRCRAEFTRAGYTIRADLGNRLSDFAGTRYRRAFWLPNYHRRL